MIFKVFAVVALLSVLSVEATPIRGCYLANWAHYRPGVGKFQVSWGLVEEKKACEEKVDFLDEELNCFGKF
jgi:hypothetical protein